MTTVTTFTTTPIRISSRKEIPRDPDGNIYVLFSATVRRGIEEQYVTALRYGRFCLPDGTETPDTKGWDCSEEAAQARLEKRLAYSKDHAEKMRQEKIVNCSNFSEPLVLIWNACIEQKSVAEIAELLKFRFSEARIREIKPKIYRRLKKLAELTDNQKYAKLSHSELLKQMREEGLWLTEEFFFPLIQSQTASKAESASEPIVAHQQLDDGLATHLAGDHNVRLGLDPQATEPCQFHALDKGHPSREL